MKTIIVDVRTEKEFLEGSYPGAINIPHGEFDPKLFQKFRNNHIALLCFSGNRAGKVLKLLKIEGFKHASVLQYQMVHIEEESKSTKGLWTIDRQFRLALGVLLGIALINNLLNFSVVSTLIFVGLFGGLMFSALTDNCYLKSLISILPWNTAKKIESNLNNKELLSEY